MLEQIKRELRKIKREIADPVIEEVVRDTAVCILETEPPDAIAVQRIEAYPGRLGWYAWIAEYPEEGGIDITAFDVLTRGRPKLAARRVRWAAVRVVRAAREGVREGLYAFHDALAVDGGAR